MDLGFLIARIVFGVLMAAHGAQKMFGWFGGYGLTGTGGFFEGLGFKPGRLFAAAAAGGEIVSGLLIALGLFGPIGPALVLSIMIVAAVTVHWHGVFAMSNGVEVPLLYATAAVALALTGFGRFSLDALLGITNLWTPAIVAGTLAAGVAGGIINLSLRRRPVTVS
ncbi:MAG TPA: DoxX family protein [Thermoanaerobaculia bacterium]